MSERNYELLIVMSSILNVRGTRDEEGVEVIAFASRGGVLTRVMTSMLPSLDLAMTKQEASLKILFLIHLRQIHFKLF